jgi:hypothetical protein
MPNAGSRRVTLYMRDGCHLCEDASVLLDEMIGRDGYSSIDIEADDDLLARYGHRIPMVTVDGVEHAEGLITQPDLAPLLDR